jgi:hypothetical protein
LYQESLVKQKGKAKAYAVPTNNKASKFNKSFTSITTWNSKEMFDRA